jgi:hypothetical protein
VNFCLYFPYLLSSWSEIACERSVYDAGEFVNVDTGKTILLFLACMKLHDNDFCLIYSPCKNTVFRMHFWSLHSEHHISFDCTPYFRWSHKNNKLKKLLMKQGRWLSHVTSSVTILRCLMKISGMKIGNDFCVLWVAPVWLTHGTGANCL